MIGERARAFSACACMLLVFASREVSVEQSQPLQVYAQYARGDRDAIPRAFSSPDSYRAQRNDLRKAIDSWKHVPAARDVPVGGTAWYPSRAAFVLEVASTVKGFDFPEAVRLFDDVRELVGSRPGRRSTDAQTLDADDRFEVAIHRAVIAMLSDTPTGASRYLDLIESRVSALQRLNGGRELVAPLILARGIVAAIRARPDDDDASQKATATAPVVLDQLELSSDRQAASAREKWFAEAERAFNDAGRVTSVAAEAAVHRAWLLHEWGRDREALTLLKPRRAPASDPGIDYCRALLRGRIFASQGQPAAAKQAFEHAADVAPDAQTAAVALAALLLKEGDITAAARWAARAATPVTGAAGPRPTGVASPRPGVRSL